MDMVAMMHDNNVYGLTKMQVSPTTPQGAVTNTTPFGAHLRALNPLTTTLGVTNASFVAQVVEWVPDLMYDVLKEAFHHKGFSFIRILQRCPHFMPDMFSNLMGDPKNILFLRHENGVQPSEAIEKIYTTQEEHDPSNLNRAREIAEMEDKVPVGILYRDESVTRYEDVRRSKRKPSAERNKEVLENLFDSVSITPRAQNKRGGNGDEA